jgi:Rieske Fe-S protein
VTQRVSRRSALTGAAALGVTVSTLTACGSEDSSGDPGGEGTTSSGAGGDLGATADIPEGGGAIFAEAGVVVTQPTAGEFKGFSNICTHQNCPVNDVTATINCTCHGSKFSITDGSVVSGPAPKPLPEVKLAVDGDKIAKA